MTFVTHKISGGVLHLAAGKWFLALLGPVLGEFGLAIPELAGTVFLYLCAASGSYFGGFPDTEDWIVAEGCHVGERWSLYHRCHVTDLYQKWHKIPAWWWHVFCDLFAHPPKEGEKKKWYQMDPAWKELRIWFTTWWNMQYVFREAAVLGISYAVLRYSHLL